VHFILSIPVIVLFLVVHQTLPSLNWLWGIPILLAIHLTMSLGLALVFATLNLFLRDIERLVGILVHFTFYLTPILYSEDLIPPEYKNYIYLNPAAPLIISWRQLFLEGTIIPMYLLASFGYALVFFGIGYLVYSKLSWKFAEVI
jgi:lipopolysaccharide transport system permease protein